jgi:hypothetical protein
MHRLGNIGYVRTALSATTQMSPGVHAADVIDLDRRSHLSNTLDFLPSETSIPFWTRKTDTL